MELELVATGDHFAQGDCRFDHHGGVSLEGLRTTFITPFDRADTQSLITSMDDFVDECKATAKGIMLFEMQFRA